MWRALGASVGLFGNVSTLIWCKVSEIEGSKAEDFTIGPAWWFKGPTNFMKKSCILRKLLKSEILIEETPNMGV